MKPYRGKHVSEEDLQFVQLPFTLVELLLHLVELLLDLSLPSYGQCFWPSCYGSWCSCSTSSSTIGIKTIQIA